MLHWPQPSNAGFTVEFKMTSQMNNALQATIAENVGLIRSIPEKYFTPSGRAGYAVGSAWARPVLSHR
jgi:hypothetical protein